MARTEAGVEMLQEKAIELAKLKKLVRKLAEENEFDLPGEGWQSETYGDNVYTDWNNSSCYGEDAGEAFGVDSDGKIWYPSSC